VSIALNTVNIIIILHPSNNTTFIKNTYKTLIEQTTNDIFIYVWKNSIIGSSL